MPERPRRRWGVSGGNDLSPPGISRGQESAAFQKVAGSIDPSADDVQGVDEMLGEHRVGGHVGSGPRPGGTSGSGTEELGRRADVVGVDKGPFGHIPSSKGGDGCLKGVEAVYVVLTEILVDEPQPEDLAQYPSQESGVLTGLDLQPKVSGRGQFGPTRVDDDHRQPSFLSPAQGHEGVGSLESAGWRITRDQRVVANSKTDVCVGEVVPARFPRSHSQGRRPVGRLVDGDRGVERGRIESPVPRAGHGHRRGVLVGAGSRITGHCPRAVAGHDVVDSPGDRVEGLLGRNGPERALLGALQRRPQPVGMVVLVRQLATLDACVALEERIVPVAVDLDHPPAILNVDKDRARGVTYPAE